MDADSKRAYTRRGFLTTTTSAGLAMYLAACGSSGSSSTAAKSGSGAASSGPVTLNNLFQQQAGYSASDLAGMTKAFEAANPNIKVNNTLVAYEALHDKIVAAAPAGTYDVVLGDVIWPAEFGSKGIVRDISSQVHSLTDRRDLPRRAEHGQLPRQVLRHAVDPGHQVPVRQRPDAQEGRGHPPPSSRPGPACCAAQAVQEGRMVEYPWLVAGPRPRRCL